MEVTKKINIDLVQRGAVQRVEAKQGDANSRAVQIALYAEGNAWSVPPGAAIVIRYRKADGTAGMYDTLPDGSAAASVSGHEINVQFAPQMLTCPGVVRADLVLTNNAQILATFDFLIHVAQSPVGNAELESQDYYKLASLAQLNAAIDNLRLSVGQCVRSVNGVPPDVDGNINVSSAVASVNGKTGAVVLDAASVGAVPAAGGRMTGNLNMGGKDIVGAAAVSSEQFTVLRDEDPDAGAWIAAENPITDASGTPQKQVLALYGIFGDEATILRNVGSPEQDYDAATKGYVDNKIAEIGTSGGTSGADGKSAYQLAVEAGFTGTVQEWLASLKGADGRGIVAVARTTGDGLAGTVDTYTITYTDGTTSTFTVRNGANGEDGADGADGGYYTPTLTVDGTLSWNGSKSGMPPVQSANIKGAPGANGKSAYQLAVEAGFTGTLQEWLASLQGAPGQDGANGTDGGYYTPSVSDDGTLVFMASKQGMPPVVPIDLHEYISAILPGGYCSTGAAVADKIESYINREITAGSLVSIQFAGTNTADNPTLTVNGVKAAIVGGNGEAIAPSMLGAGERVFLYTTSQKWVLLNPQVDVLPAATAADSGKVATVGSNGSYGLAYPQMPVVATTVTNIEMQPNVKYKWGVATSLTLSFAPEVPGIVNEYCGEFFSSDPATNFACPLSVNWVTPLNIEVGKHYEFSIINGIGVIAGV